MYKPMKWTLAAALLGAHLGCGAGTAQDYANAAPTYQTLALDMESSDGSAQQGAALTPPSCHPHLFQRTREVVRTLNAHIWMVAHRVEAAIDAHPDQKSGTTRTWIRTVDGISVKASLDETSPGNYTFEASVAPAGSSNYTQYLTGTVVAGSAPHEGTGTLTMDLTALGTVDKAVKAQGQFSVNYSVDGATKVISVTLNDFQPPNGFNAADQAIRPPRSGTYVFTRTNGVGGSLKFNEQVDLLCPAQPDPANPEIATVETVAVWAHDPTTGDLVGRADSQATGGQIASGDKWEGVTCFDLSKDDGSGATAEGYWMMKAEDASGNTLHLDATTDSAEAPAGTTPCNSLFGAVPDLTDSAHDYDFAAINFGDASVVPYPGQPSGSSGNADGGS